MYPNLSSIPSQTHMADLRRAADRDRLQRAADDASRGLAPESSTHRRRRSMAQAVARARRAFQSAL